MDTHRRETADSTRRATLLTLLAVATTGCVSGVDTGANTDPSSTVETASNASVSPTAEATPSVDADPRLDATVVRQPDGSEPGRVQLRLYNDTSRTLDVRFGNVPPFSRFASASVEGRRLLLLPTIDRQATSPPVDQLVPDQPSDRQVGDVSCWTATGELYPVQFFTDESLHPGASVTRSYTVVWATDSNCGPGTYSFERTTSGEAEIRLASTVEIAVATDGSLSATAETALHSPAETA